MKNLIIVMFTVALLGITPAFADDNESRTRALSLSIMSPFCPGRSLEDCPSEKASDLKREIRTKLDQGKSEDEVLNDLYAMYGQEISAVPSGIFAWGIPIGVVLIGLLVIFLRSKGRSNEAEI